MAEPIDDEGVTIGQALEAADQPERVVRHFLGSEFPHGLAFGIQLNDGLALAAGDQPHGGNADLDCLP